jgi:hypothetical protein
MSESQKQLRERGIEPLANRNDMMATIKVTTTPFTLVHGPLNVHTF